MSILVELVNEKFTICMHGACAATWACHKVYNGLHIHTYVKFAAYIWKLNEVKKVMTNTCNHTLVKWQSLHTEKQMRHLCCSVGKTCMQAVISTCIAGHLRLCSQLFLCMYVYNSYKWSYTNAGLWALVPHHIYYMAIHMGCGVCQKRTNTTCVYTMPTDNMRMPTCMHKKYIYIYLYIIQQSV